MRPTAPRTMAASVIAERRRLRKRLRMARLVSMCVPFNGGRTILSVSSVDDGRSRLSGGGGNGNGGGGRDCPSSTGDPGVVGVHYARHAGQRGRSGGPSRERRPHGCRALG